jgi:hypothetical protein
MNNLATALAMILCVETPNMNPRAVGDLHLPIHRQAKGRMQIRKTVLDDMTRWDSGKFTWTHEDSMNPELDILMAQRYLIHYCGENATVKRYCQVWNGGPIGWRSPDAQSYYSRAVVRRNARPDHFEKCKQEVQRRTR